MVGALGSPVLFEVRKAPGAPGVWEIQWVCTEAPGLERWRDEDGGGGLRMEEGCAPILPATSSQILQMCLGSCLGTEVTKQLGSALRFSVQSSENPVF